MPRLVASGRPARAHSDASASARTAKPVPSDTLTTARAPSRQTAQAAAPPAPGEGRGIAITSGTRARPVPARRRRRLHVAPRDDGGEHARPLLGARGRGDVHGLQGGGDPLLHRVGQREEPATRAPHRQVDPHQGDGLGRDRVGGGAAARAPDPRGEGGRRRGRDRAGAGVAAAGESQHGPLGRRRDRLAPRSVPQA